MDQAKFLELVSLCKDMDDDRQKEAIETILKSVRQAADRYHKETGGSVADLLTALQRADQEHDVK